MNAIIEIIKSIGTSAIAQLSGPKAWIATLVVKAVVFLLDYFGVKHDFKKQSEEKLKEYEAALVNPELTEEQKNEARKNFLK